MLLMDAQMVKGLRMPWQVGRMCGAACVIVTECVLCRYAAYSITPHTSPDQPSSVPSSFQTVTFSSGDVAAEANRPGSKAGASDKLSIDNGIILVNFSDITGQIVALINRQAQVGCMAPGPTVI